MTRDELITLRAKKARISRALRNITWYDRWVLFSLWVGSELAEIDGMPYLLHPEHESEDERVMIPSYFRLRELGLLGQGVAFAWTLSELGIDVCKRIRQEAQLWAAAGDEPLRRTERKA